MKLSKWLMGWIEKAVELDDICIADAVTLRNFARLVKKLEDKYARAIMEKSTTRTP